MTPVSEATETQKRLWREHNERRKRLSPTTSPKPTPKWRPLYWQSVPPPLPPKWMRNTLKLFPPKTTLKEVLQAANYSRNIPPPIVIRRMVAASMGFTEADILGESRKVAPTMARHIAMYLSREMVPTLSLPRLGRHFGGRDHTTVLNAIRKIQRMMASNPELAERVAKLRHEIAEKLNATGIQQKS